MRPTPLPCALLLTLAAACATAPRPASPPPAPRASEKPQSPDLSAKAPPATLHEATPTPQDAPPPPAGPVTHLGRAVLSAADTVVRATSGTWERGLPGVLLGRATAEEWLRGVPGEPGETILVFAGDATPLPPAGAACVLFLATRPESRNYGLVEWTATGGAEGAARLAALRSYLRVEAIEDAAARSAALTEYLRGAVASEDAWTRSNAAREYAAYAAQPGARLGEGDRAALEAALARTSEKRLRAFLESALAQCPGARSAPAEPGPAAGAAGALASYEARYGAADASLAERRRAVIEAALALGKGSDRLLARALEDRDAPVREAALAAAANFEVRSLAPRVKAILAGDPSPVVRRTAAIAAGRLRCEDCVAALGALARAETPLAQDALFALARIRSADALEELRRSREEASDAERRSTIDFLLSDAFLAQERALANPLR